MTLAYKHTEDKAKIDLDEDDDLFQGGNGFARVCLESKFWVNSLRGKKQYL